LDKALSQDDIAAIVKDDIAFRTWTIVNVVRLQSDLYYMRRILSPSLWCNVIMAAGAASTIIYLLIGGHL
jgi:hypothetical protein